jgi:hypothetical protein
MLWVEAALCKLQQERRLADVCGIPEKVSGAGGGTEAQQWL